MKLENNTESTAGSDCPAASCYPSSFGPRCRVKVDSISTYKGRYGTITEANGMPDRWFVAIDDDDRFAEVSFYARDLIYIPEDNDERVHHYQRGRASITGFGL